MLVRILEVIRKILGFPEWIKKLYKMKKFRRYAACGEGLKICAKSNCDAERSGLITIGKKCEIYGRLESQAEGRIELGDHTAIFHRSVIGSVNSIRIGSCVVISNHVHIYDNNNHPVSPKRRREMCMAGFEGDAWHWTHAESTPIVIEDNVWIGEYSAILKGVTIGTGAIVASHAVVTKDVPPYTIVAGNPARVVKEIENDEV